MDVSSVCAQSEEREFRWAVESERHANGADAPIDVQAHAAELEPALNKAFSHGRKNQSADEGQTNLSAMRMSAEHQVNGLAGLLRLNVRRVIGCVAQQYQGFIAPVPYHIWNRGIEIRMADNGIVQTGKPKSSASTLDGEERISQDVDAIGAKCRFDDCRPYGYIMIAEDGVNGLAFQAFQNPCTFPGCFVGH